MFVRCRPFLLIFVLALILPALLIACGSEAPTERPGHGGTRGRGRLRIDVSANYRSRRSGNAVRNYRRSCLGGCPIGCHGHAPADPHTAANGHGPVRAPVGADLFRNGPRSAVAFYNVTDGENWIQPQLAERRANRRVGGSHHCRQWPRHRTGPLGEPVERGATAGAGQLRHPERAGPRREPVEWVHTRQPTRPVGYAVFRPGWSAVLLRRRRAPQWSRPK